MDDLDKFFSDVKRLEKTFKESDISLVTLPEETAKHVRALIHSDDDELLNGTTLSEYVDIPEDLLSWLLSFDWQLDWSILYNDLNSHNLRRALEYVDITHLGGNGETFLSAIYGLRKYSLSLKHQMALIKNKDFLDRLILFPTYLNLFIPNKELIIKKFFHPKRLMRAIKNNRYHSYEFCGNYLKQTLHSDEEKEMLINLFLDTGFFNKKYNNYSVEDCLREILSNICHYQELTFEQLYRLTKNERVSYCLAPKKPNAFVPTWTRKDDPYMISENMPQEYFEKCMKSNRKGVQRWLAVVCPKKSLPLFISEDKTLKDIVTFRLNGNKKKFKEVRAELAETVFKKEYDNLKM